MGGCCKAVKNAGLKGIQSSAGGFTGKALCNPDALLREEDAMNKFKRVADENGLEINALICYGNPLHPQKSIAEKHIADLNAAIKLASKIGVKVINCFAGCPGAREGAKYPNWITCAWPPYFGESVKGRWEKKVIPFWKKIVKVAKKAGVKFGFEMHPGDINYNTETILKLREEVGAEEISCNFDPAHLFWQGMDPIVCIKRQIV